MVSENIPLLPSNGFGGIFRKLRPWRRQPNRVLYFIIRQNWRFCFVFSSRAVFFLRATVQGDGEAILIRRIDCCRSTTTERKMIPMATMSTKVVGINTVDRDASQTTRSPRNVSGLGTSNGPQAEGVLGIIGCKSLKTVVGPWRLERQTSTVSR